MTLDADLKAFATARNFAAMTTLMPDGQPQNQIMWVHADDEHVIINTEAGRQKFRNVQRDPRVSLVVDDLATMDPWAPRGIEIRGTAEALPDASPPRPGFSPGLIRIHPTRVLGWGLDTDAFAPPNARDVDTTNPT